MAGLIDYDPIGQGPASEPATPAIVFRDGVPLLNVECVSVSLRVGAEPGTARFRYRFDQLHPEWPSTIEQVLALSTPGGFAGSPHVVSHEDFLVVAIPLPDGLFEPIFSGFATLPQANYGGSEEVTFEAIGAPVRCWDHPVPGALYRDATDTEAGDARWTGLPTRFNPDGRANATPEGFDHKITGASGTAAESPIFVDDLYLSQFDIQDLPDRGRRWSLAMAARYLIAGGNVDQEWVANPDLDALDSILVSVKPTGGPIDWSDPATFELSPILIADTDVTGMSWPEALESLLVPHGFAMAFTCGPGPGGGARWRLVVRRNDDNTYWKTLGLQARGSALDPSLTAVGEFGIQRDGLVANQIAVDAGLERVEASFLLAPVGWEVAANDIDASKRNHWIHGQEDFDPIAYRVFGIDECGEGHWVFAAGDTGETSLIPPDLDKVFDPQAKRSEYDYFVRRRPAVGRELLSVDANGRPKSAELWFGTLGTKFDLAPGVWDASAWAGVEWQQVTEGGWKLLEDRLGVLITTEDARSWNVTKEGERPVAASGVLDLVKSLAKPSDVAPRTPRIVLRLTCVVEGDRGLPAAVAERRAQSPARYTTERRVDARDRFRKESTSASHLGGGGGAEGNVRDDTARAQAYAESMRREHEAIRFAGSITVPRITVGVSLADKLIGIPGRDLYFGVYAPGSGEGDRYPMVVGLDWTFRGSQSTRIMLADRRAEA